MRNDTKSFFYLIDTCYLKNLFITVTFKKIILTLLRKYFCVNGYRTLKKKIFCTYTYIFVFITLNPRILDHAQREELKN